MKGLALVLAVLALSACQATAPQPVASTGPRAALVDLGDRVRLSVPGTVATVDSPDSTCAKDVYSLRTSEGDFLAYLLLPGCSPTDSTPENGNHGFYPTPPRGALTEQVTTPLGPATVFSNQYADCTSSCYLGTDEVALVAYGSGVVQVVAVTAPAGGTTARDRAGLVTVLQGLRRD